MSFNSFIESFQNGPQFDFDEFSNRRARLGTRRPMIDNQRREPRGDMISRDQDEQQQNIIDDMLAAIRSHHGILSAAIQNQQTTLTILQHHLGVITDMLDKQKSSQEAFEQLHRDFERIKPPREQVSGTMRAANDGYTPRDWTSELLSNTTNIDHLSNEIEKLKLTHQQLDLDSERLRDSAGNVNCASKMERESVSLPQSPPQSPSQSEQSENSEQSASQSPPRSPLQSASQPHLLPPAKLVPKLRIDDVKPDISCADENCFDTAFVSIGMSRKFMEHFVDVSRSSVMFDKIVSPSLSEFTADNVDWLSNCILVICKHISKLFETPVLEIEYWFWSHPRRYRVLELVQDRLDEYRRILPNTGPLSEIQRRAMYEPEDTDEILKREESDDKSSESFDESWYHGDSDAYEVRYINVREGDGSRDDDFSESESKDGIKVVNKQLVDEDDESLVNVSSGISEGDESDKDAQKFWHYKHDNEILPEDSSSRI